MYDVSELNHPMMRELELTMEKVQDARIAFVIGKISWKELELYVAKQWSSFCKRMAKAGIICIPGLCFTCFDKMLETTCMVGAVPPRYGWRGGKIGSNVYGLMARGSASCPAMEMTEWFGTNYRFILPELGPDVNFSYASSKVVTAYKRAKALGVNTVPVLVGPVSYLLLSKPAKGVEETFCLLSLLGKLLPIYKEVVSELKAAGASRIQFDEPTLVLDLDSHKLQSFTEAYSELTSSLSGVNFVIKTYFGDVPPVAYKVLTSLKSVTGVDFELGTKTFGFIEGGSPTVQCSSNASCVSVPVRKSKNFWTGKIKADQSTQDFSHQAFGQGYDHNPGVTSQPFPGHGPSQRENLGKSLMRNVLRGAVQGLAHEAVLALFS